MTRRLRSVAELERQPWPWWESRIYDLVTRPRLGVRARIARWIENRHP